MRGSIFIVKKNCKTHKFQNKQILPVAIVVDGNCLLWPIQRE